jgi:hypothetical protein
MELPFKKLTLKIFGCAMEVHRVLGPGLWNIFIKEPRRFECYCRTSY